MWQQYTPYFNDGDSCVFRVCEPSFLRAIPVEEGEEPVEKDDEEEDYDADEDEDGIVIGSSTDEHEEGYVKEYASGVPDPHGMKQFYIDKIATYKAGKTLIDNCEEFAKFFEENDPIFELVFGDHVKVIATRNGFKVTEYEHD